MTFQCLSKLERYNKIIMRFSLNEYIALPDEIVWAQNKTPSKQNIRLHESLTAKRLCADILWNIAAYHYNQYSQVIMV